MRRESVWKVATLPVVALLVWVTVLVVALGVRGDATHAGDSLPRDRQTVRDLRTMAELNTALLQSLTTVWTASMGHPERVDKADARAAVAMDVARQSRTLREPLAPSGELLSSLGSETPLKERLDILRQTHALFLSTLSTVENRLGPDVLPLQGYTGRRLGLGDLFSKITAKRTLLGVDTTTPEAFVTMYMTGLVASDVQPPKSLQDFLTFDVRDADARAKLSALAGRQDLAPLDEAIRWSLAAVSAPQPAGASSSTGGPAYTELAMAHDNAVMAIDGLIADELSRLDRRLDRRSDQTDMTIAASSIVGAVALAAGLATFGWLLRRLRRAMSALRSLAEMDALTGVMNRSGLRRVVEPWFADRGSGSVAVAVVDLDKFKDINDTHGHEAGDVVLASVAKRIVASTIAESTSVARWGGDEYVIAFRLPPGATASSVESMIARIRSSLSMPVDFGDTMLVVTATIGVSTCACGGCEFDDLFRSADHSLYVGKFAGRNRFTSVDCTFDMHRHLLASTGAAGESAGN